MTFITLSGRAGCGKTTRANQLYAEHVRAGRHVVLNDDGSTGVKNSHPERTTAPDVTITTKVAGHSLQVTTTGTRA